MRCNASVQHSRAELVVDHCYFNPTWPLPTAATVSAAFARVDCALAFAEFALCQLSINNASALALAAAAKTAKPTIPVVSSAIAGCCSYAGTASSLAPLLQLSYNTLTGLGGCSYSLPSSPIASPAPCTSAALTVQSLCQFNPRVVLPTTIPAFLAKTECSQAFLVYALCAINSINQTGCGTTTPSISLSSALQGTSCSFNPSILPLITRAVQTYQSRNITTPLVHTANGMPCTATPALVYSQCGLDVNAALNTSTLFCPSQACAVAYTSYAVCFLTTTPCTAPTGSVRYPACPDVTHRIQSFLSICYTAVVTQSFTGYLRAPPPVASGCTALTVYQSSSLNAPFLTFSSSSCTLTSLYGALSINVLASCYFNPLTTAPPLTSSCSVPCAYALTSFLRCQQALFNSSTSLLLSANHSLSSFPVVVTPPALVSSLNSSSACSSITACSSSRTLVSFAAVCVASLQSQAVLACPFRVNGSLCSTTAAVVYSACLGLNVNNFTATAEYGCPSRTCAVAYASYVSCYLRQTTCPSSSPLSGNSTVYTPCPDITGAVYSFLSTCYQAVSTNSFTGYLLPPQQAAQSCNTSAVTLFLNGVAADRMAVISPATSCTAASLNPVFGTAVLQSCYFNPALGVTQPTQSSQCSVACAYALALYIPCYQSVANSSFAQLRQAATLPHKFNSTAAIVTPAATVNVSTNSTTCSLLQSCSVSSALQSYASTCLAQLRVAATVCLPAPAPIVATPAPTANLSALSVRSCSGFVQPVLAVCSINVNLPINFASLQIRFSNNSLSKECARTLGQYLLCYLANQPTPSATANSSCCSINPDMVTLSAIVIASLKNQTAVGLNPPTLSLITVGGENCNAVAPQLFSACGGLIEQAGSVYPNASVVNCTVSCAVQLTIFAQCRLRSSVCAGGSFGSVAIPLYPSLPYPQLSTNATVGQGRCVDLDQSIYTSLSFCNRTLTGSALPSPPSSSSSTASMRSSSTFSSSMASSSTFSSSKASSSLVSTSTPFVTSSSPVPTYSFLLLLTLTGSSFSVTINATLTTVSLTPSLYSPTSIFSVVAMQGQRVYSSGGTSVISAITNVLPAGSFGGNDDLLYPLSSSIVNSNGLDYQLYPAAPLGGVTGTFSVINLYTSNGVYTEEVNAGVESTVTSTVLLVPLFPTTSSSSVASSVPRASSSAFPSSSSSSPASSAPLTCPALILAIADGTLTVSTTVPPTASYSCFLGFGISQPNGTYLSSVVRFCNGTTGAWTGSDASYVCQPIPCNNFTATTGSISGGCSGLGYCVQPNQCACAIGFNSSAQCGSCSRGYFGFPACQQCPSCGVGQCDSTSGACICPSNFMGASCSQCVSGLYGPGCLPIPAVSSSAPVSGPDVGGTLITIKGANFGASSRYNCLFTFTQPAQVVTAAASFVDSHTVNCTSPPSVAGTTALTTLSLSVDGSVVQYFTTLTFTFIGTCPKDSLGNLCSAQGYCTQGSCVCSFPYYGSFCQQQHVLATLSFDGLHFAVNESASFALSLQNLSSSADPVIWAIAAGPTSLGLVINAYTGQLSWLTAVASNTPYLVTVSASNVAGTTFASITLSVPTSYNATVAITGGFSRANLTYAQIVAQGGVPLSGSITFLSSYTSILPLPVTVWVDHNGARRFLPTVYANVRTLRFSAAFTPSSFEAGLFTVGAMHPQDTTAMDAAIADDSFNLLGLSVPSAPVTLSLIVELPSGPYPLLPVTNIGNEPLMQVNASSPVLQQLVQLGYAANISFVCVYGNGTAPTPVMLAPSASCELALVITLLQSFQAVIPLTVADVTGAAVTAQLTISAKHAAAVLVVSPSSTSLAIEYGSQKQLVVTVSNVGSAASGPIVALLPTNPVVTLATVGNVTAGYNAANVTTAFPALQPGASLQLTLLAQPDQSAPQGLYTNRLQLIDTSLLAKTVTATVSVLVESALFQTLVVVVNDELTYNAPGSPNVSSATVTIYNAVRGISLSAKTGSNGTVVFPNLPEDTYSITASAPNHTTYSSVVQVIVGMSPLSIFIGYLPVTYSFSVVPTLVPDVYTVTIQAVFVTAVPDPVIVVTPAILNLDLLLSGGEPVIPFVVYNYGLIQAINFTLTLPVIPGLTFTPQVPIPSTIPANSTIPIPVNVVLTGRRRRLLSQDWDNSLLQAMQPTTIADCGSVDPARGIRSLCTSRLITGQQLRARGVALPNSIHHSLSWPSTSFPYEDEALDVASSNSLNTSLMHRLSSALPSLSSAPRHLLGIGIQCFGAKFSFEIQCGKIFPFYSKDISIESSGVTVSGTISPTGGKGGVGGTIGYCAPTFGGSGSGSGSGSGGITSYDDDDGGGGDGGPTYDGGGGGGGGGFCSFSFDITACAGGSDINACVHVEGSSGGGISGGISGGGRRLLQTVNTGYETVATAITQLNTTLNGLLLGYAVNTRMQSMYYGGVGYQHIDFNHPPTWLNAFSQAQSDASDLGQLISTAEYVNLTQSVPLPTGASLSFIANFLARQNRTTTYYAMGIYTLAQAVQTFQLDLPVLSLYANSNSTLDFYNSPAVLGDAVQQLIPSNAAALDFIYQDYYAAIQQQNTALTAQATAAGYALPFTSAIQQNLQQIQTVEAENLQGVCAEVTIQLSQQVAFTRQGFLATLTVNNGDSVELTDLYVVLYFNDNAGNNATGLFSVGVPTLSGIAGSTDDGSGSIALASQGSIQWLIIPYPQAANTSASETYSVGGYMSYTLGSVPVNVPIYSSPILVHPDPRLFFHYFVPQVVLGDDPFTSQLEPSVPFTIGLVVSNEGYGAAQSLTIASSQPTIVDNQKGLLVSFRIIDTEINLLPAQPTLTGSFGTLQAQSTAVARIDLLSTLMGNFLSYNFTVVETNPNNQPQLSLFDGLDAHVSLQVVNVDNDPAIAVEPHFLTQDNPTNIFLQPDGINAYPLPDHVWVPTLTSPVLGVYEVQALWNGSAVYSTSNSSAVILQGSQTLFLLTVTPLLSAVNVSVPYLYLRVDSPIAAAVAFQSMYLISAVRNDGKALLVGVNVWTTHRIIHLSSGVNQTQDYVHLFDHNVAANATTAFTYTVTFSSAPSYTPLQLSSSSSSAGSASSSSSSPVLGSSSSSSPPSPSSSSSPAPGYCSTPAPPSSILSGSLCVVFYGLPGTIDYPFSIATSLQFHYNSTVITTSFGSAVQLLNATGQRTYTNRFGVSTSTPVTLTSSAAAQPHSLLYLGSQVPVDSQGLTWNLTSPVQLPGVGPSLLTSQLTVSSVGGVVVESGAAVLDPFGTAFLSSVGGFCDVSISAANINSLAVLTSSCQAPLTFNNGLLAPTEPSSGNGASLFSFAYTISDGVSYVVTTALTIATSSPFATHRDALGNPYQTVINVTGTRTYTHMATGAQLISIVTGPTTSTLLTPSQRFYPYALLASPPGVYSVNTAPFWDGQGLGLTVSPPIPANGSPPGTGPSYNITTLSVTPTATAGIAVLIDGVSITSPSLTFQMQTYTFSR